MKEPRSKVVLLQCKNYDVELVRDKIELGLRLLGGLKQFVKSGEKILLKPNLLAPDPPETATATHPVVFRAAAEILQDHGAVIYYGDSPGIHSTAKVLKKCGLQEVADELRLLPADFETREKIFFTGAKQNKVFEIARGVMQSDGIISLPKLKTHGLTLMTGAVKNQFGCIPGFLKPGFHAKLENPEDFSQMLVDLTMFLKPRLYIMDGIWAMDGNGPRRGRRVDLGVIIISTDPIAVDTVASQIIGLDPKRVYTIVRGHESGLGSMENIELIGEKIENVRKKFALPRYSGNYKTIPPFIRNVLRNVFVQRPVINYKRCTKCHECYKICPTNPRSIVIREDKFPKHEYSTCIRCYCCQEVCPEGAISIKTKLL